MTEREIDGLSELFLTGDCPSKLLNAPSYAETIDARHHLAPNSLQDPTTFVCALRDFLRVKLYQAAPYAIQNLQSDDGSWSRYLCALHYQLFRHYEEETSINEQIILRLSHGVTAEYIVTEYLKQLTASFNEKDLVVPEWNGDEHPIDLGATDMLVPLFPHNVYLFGKKSKEWKALAEYDASVWASDTVFFVDMTTSLRSFGKKVARERLPHALFKEFRQRMRTLYRKTDHEKGFSNTAKIHVVCTENGPFSHQTILNDTGAAVLSVEVPLFSYIRFCTNEALLSLLQENIMTNVDNRWQVSRPHFAWKLKQEMPCLER